MLVSSTVRCASLAIPPFAPRQKVPVPFLVPAAWVMTRLCNFSFDWNNFKTEVPCCLEATAGSPAESLWPKQKSIRLDNLLALRVRNRHVPKQTCRILKYAYAEVAVDMPKKDQKGLIG